MGGECHAEAAQCPRCVWWDNSSSGSFSVGHKPKVWVLLVYVWVSGSEFLNDPIPVFVL